MASSDQEAATEDNGPSRTRFRDIAVFGQCVDRYLVGLFHDELVVLDLREAYRLLTHHQMRRQHRSGGIDSQRLLVPSRVRLPEVEVDTINHHLELLSELGIDVDALVGLLAVRALPAMLDHVEPAALLLELAGQLRLDPQPDLLMHVMAVHGSVRSDRSHDLYGLRTLLAALDDLPRTPKQDGLMVVLDPGIIASLFDGSLKR